MGDRQRLALDCVGWAWKGSVSFANAWGPIAGAIPLAGLFWLTGRPVHIPDGLLGIAAVAAMCLGAAWVLIFVGRLAIAPFHLALDARRQAIPDEADTRHTEAIEAHTAELREQNEWRRRETDPVWVALRHRAEQVASKAMKPILGVKINIIRVELHQNGRLCVPVEVSNTGEPTTLHDWSLSIVTNSGRKIFFDSFGPLGLDAQGDLYTTPLEKGGRRYGTFEPLDTVAFGDGILMEGTAYTLEAKDVTGRMISTTYKVKP